MENAIESRTRELKAAKKNSNTIILVCLLAVPVRLGG